MEKNSSNRANNKALSVIKISDIQWIWLPGNIYLKSLCVSIFSDNKTDAFISFPIRHCEWWLNCMLFPIHPNVEVCYLGPILIIILKLCPCSICRVYVHNCTFADKGPTRDTLTLQLNYPYSSAGWDSLYFYIVYLD